MWLWMSYDNVISRRHWITPWITIEMHPNTSSLTNSSILSTIARNMLSARSANRKYSTRTDLEAHYQLYHPILMNEGRSAELILPPAGWDRPEPACFNLSQHTWKFIDELVNQKCTHRRCMWCATTGRYSRQRNNRPPEAWSDKYPWSNRDKGS